MAVLLQPISGGSAINPLVAFYHNYWGKREFLFFYFIPDTTRDCYTFFYRMFYFDIMFLILFLTQFFAIGTSCLSVVFSNTHNYILSY
jgi:hypothetical protein